MERKIKFGWALVVVGVIANNYVYMHDIVTDGHGGAIYLGWKAGAAIILTLVVITVGLVMAWRAGTEIS